MEANTDGGPVVIDRSNDAEKYRFVCPNGHIDWDKTNNHIWCRSCRRQAENGVDVEPEHWKVHDKKTGESIPWKRIETIEPDPRAEFAQ